MTLPKAIWSEDDIHVAWKVVQNPSKLISRAWATWNEDPTKIAVFRAMVPCQARIGHLRIIFGWDMGKVLARNLVCFLHSYSLEVEEVHY